jgi:hypothetical protein
MKSYSVQSILDWLSTKGLLRKRQQAEAFLLTRSNANVLPTYIQVIMGIGAFLGCICIIGFLFATNLISLNNNASLLISGGVAIAIALIIYFSMRHQRLLLQSFALQSALVLMVAGKVLFVMGFAQLNLYTVLHISKEWMTPVGIFIVTAPMYILFPVAIDRFVSTLALIFFLLILTITQYNTNLYFFIFYLLLIMITCFLFAWRSKSLHWSPLTYACVLGLCASAFYLASPFNISFQTNTIASLYFNIPLGLALLGLSLSLGCKKYYFMQLPLIAACIGIVILTLISTPGILLSLGMLGLSYAKHERILFILACVFLSLFLFHFYYSLPYSLDYKAGILVASGVVLLASRMIIKQMKWDSEV